jgi:acetyl esterase/lipase
MPAVWMSTTVSDYTSAKVVVHFQGGAFVLAPNPADAGTPAAEIFAKELGAITFYAQYRLPRDDASKSPAAIQDAVTFYHYLLKRGFRAENIIISSDSAGGNVALVLLCYIESSKLLPPPRGVMLWSPWIDVSDAAIARARENKNRSINFLPIPLLRWGKRAVEPLKMSRHQETDHYLRPIEHPFHSREPIFVNKGTL